MKDKKTDTIIDDINPINDISIDIQRVIKKHFKKEVCYVFSYMDTDEIGWPGGEISNDESFFTSYLIKLFAFNRAIEKSLSIIQEPVVKRQMKDYLERHGKIIGKITELVVKQSKKNDSTR